MCKVLLNLIALCCLGLICFVVELIGWDEPEQPEEIEREEV